MTENGPPPDIKVLLVEDNPGDARLVEFMLEEVDSYRFEIRRAVRLEEALDLLLGAGEDFDVALLDLSLPDAQGLEAVNRLREADLRLPLVVLSGLDDEGAALSALGSGAEDYLVKGRGGGDLVARAIRYAIERKKAEERLSFLSQYDPLTGLANRVLLLDRLAQACARVEREGTSVALLFLDLDRFKAVNDALGHEFGDALLKTVALRLGELIKEGDTVARMGSDEFAVVLEGFEDVQEVAPVVREIFESVSRPFSFRGHEVFTTASAGVAVLPPSSEESLITDAVAAMERAKEQGRDNYQFFTREMNVQAFERLAMESSLRRALDREEFELHYQPQVELSTGRIVGVEALLRWRHPDLGVVSPGQFIPILEETGLIVPVGEWVLGRACDQAHAWQEAGMPPLRVAVNLSGRQFAHDIAGGVSGALGAAGLSPDCLELEITESLLMQNAEASVAMLEELKSGQGIRISVDDFGTGYSSLAYLRRFPLDVLKIDRSFVRDVVDDPDSAAIVAAIIVLAHNLRLKVIAEGVETPEQLAYLREQGCDEVQGHYFSTALPAPEVTDLIRENDGRLSRSG
jgi:diguanylate cyclase (GGDEF)-like protein